MSRGPVLLAPGVWRIPTFGQALINSFAFAESDGSLTLVDAGYRFAPRRLLAGIAALGKRPEDVKRIVLTHAHNDHAGGLAKLARTTGAPVDTHEAEAEYIRQGKAPPLDRRNLLARVVTHMPGLDFPATDVGSTFADGEELDVAGGLLVIHTPGHSPGHCSLLHRASGVLITGDALFNFRRITYSPKLFCTNIPLSRETADRLGEIDYEIAAFTHGPEIREGAREAIRSFLRRRLKEQ